MQCLLSSGRFFLRSHFYKAEPQGFPGTPSDNTGGYHRPKRSEEIVQPLIRIRLWKTLDEQYLPHINSLIMGPMKTATFSFPHAGHKDIGQQEMNQPLMLFAGLH